jgi:hypothetical protein
MEISARGLWTLIHGMGFGALYLLACSGAIVELWRRYGKAAAPVTASDEAFLRVYFGAMTLLAWLTVFTGAYVIYPWYRAAAPAGTVKLAGFSQALLQSSPATSAWHSIGMEWKEHVAWLAPISITMASAVFVKYGRSIQTQPQLRNAVMYFVVVSFLTAGIAGFFGAMIDKKAPVEGGPIVHFTLEESR